ncbi:WD40/YVTN/BNR-like repeat-containing protein [Paenibacillus cremeus]|uniref:Photosynthesis system II assembly factor Ycf48/Hcf136-like domain-containing protein n=1 Tax=Paenibacillus cremeus TaxID=2163881 RepID=A0A559KI41_9BACL|nr:hypothetical protein [Paenibacillus cremeus]TVY11805.1 hypothetical protein FPZ49_00480 [Paenibacillus cremeus]
MKAAPFKRRFGAGGWCMLALAILLTVTGCKANTGEQAASPGSNTVSPSPNVSPSPSPTPSPSPSPSPAASIPVQPVSGKPATGSVPASETGTGTPFVLSSMSFINMKEGWSAAETKQGSDIWKTADEGATWSKASIPGLIVRGIGFASASTGWAVGKADCREQQGQRLCSKLQIVNSGNGGAAWSNQWQQQVKDVNLYTDDKIFPVSDKLVYAIAGPGMLRTTDGGKQWNAIDFHVGPFIPEEASFLPDGKNGWVLGRAGKGCKPEEREARDQCAVTVVSTSDGGATWKLDWSPEDSNNMRTVGISFIDAKQGWLMVLSLDTLQSSTLGTTDGGAHWTKLSEMRGARPYTRGLQFVSAKIGFVPLSAGAGPIGGGLAVTKDGGKSFESKVTPGQEWSFEQLQFFSEKSGWVRVGDPSKGDYLMETTDGGNTWKPHKPQL